MALLNTIGSYYIPGGGKYSDYSPPKGMYIQTSASIGLTAAAAGMLQSASTAKLGCGVNAFHLTSLYLYVTAPTSTAELSVYIGSTKLVQFATAASGQFNFSFGPLGLVGPDVATTNTVSLASAVGGCTVRYIVTGFYEV